MKFWKEKWSDYYKSNFGKEEWSDYYKSNFTIKGRYKGKKIEMEYKQKNGKQNKDPRNPVASMTNF